MGLHITGSVKKYEKKWKIQDLGSNPGLPALCMHPSPPSQLTIHYFIQTNKYIIESVRKYKKIKMRAAYSNRPMGERHDGFPESTHRSQPSGCLLRWGQNPNLQKRCNQKIKVSLPP